MNTPRLLLIPMMSVSFLISCSNSNAPATHKFSFDGTNCKINGKAHYRHNHFVIDKDVKYTIAPDVGYKLPNSIDNPNITYNNTTGVITISEFDKDITISAEALPDECTMTFNANGGEIVGEGSLEVRKGTAFKNIDNKPSASKDSCNFKGWALSSDSQVTIDENYLIASNITVYAIFIPKAEATIKFSNSSENCKLYYGEEVINKGDSITVPAGIDIELSIKSDDNYIPVFKDNLTVDGGSYTFIPEEEKILVSVSRDNTCTIEAKTELERKDLKDYDWDEISEISTNGMAPLVFKVGDEKIVTVNGQPHRVRIIGFNHDILSSSGDLPTYAGITFEFANVLSDEEGYSLTTPWNWEEAEDITVVNHNFLESSLRKALDGGGSTDVELYWYRKGQATHSQGTIYKDKPAIDMLPNDLKSVLKEVKKPIALFDDVEKEFTVNSSDYNTKLFCLSYQEISEDSTEDAETEGDTYEYYKRSSDGDYPEEIRIKSQVKGAEGAIEGPTSITDSPWGSHNPENFAGEGFGSNYWLRSPCTKFHSTSKYATEVTKGGFLTLYNVYDAGFSIAPAFCI